MGFMKKQLPAGGGKRTPKTSRLRHFEENRTPGLCSWSDMDAGGWDALARLIDLGIGVFLGRTSDGGRLTATLMDDGDKLRWYDDGAGMTERFMTLRDEVDTNPKE